MTIKQSQIFSILKTLLASTLALCTFYALTPVTNAGPLMLIHGANITAASFHSFQNLLAKQGIRSFAPQLYTEEEKLDLSEASRRLCSELKKFDEPVDLLGHSQAGAIITEATRLCPQNISTLIFLSAVIPQPDEKVFARLSDADIENFDKCAILNEQKFFIPNSPRGCHISFMNSITSYSKALDIYEKYFVGEYHLIGESKAQYNREEFAKIPKFYIKTLEDMIVSPETQQAYIDDINFETIHEIDADHLAYLSRPEELLSVLKTILNYHESYEL